MELHTVQHGQSLKGRVVTGWDITGAERTRAPSPREGEVLNRVAPLNHIAAMEAKLAQSPWCRWCHGSTDFGRTRMPRLPRLHIPGGFYHVILRGNHREDLFSSSADRLILNDIVAESIDKYSARVHAFCWMTNHLHALMQIGEVTLGKVVQCIATRYSRYRHRQLHTTGHLFERRHRAWVVEADTYLVALLRYIHLNPVAAGIVHAADEYPWSSHRAYLGIEIIPWLTIDFGLSLFGSTVESARLVSEPRVRRTLRIGSAPV